MCRWPLPAQSFSVVVPWDLRPYFTVSDLRRPFSSPPTTRRVTVEVFDPASTRVHCHLGSWSSLYGLGTDPTENTSPNTFPIVAPRSDRHRPHREHHFEQLFLCCMLHSRYLAMTLSLAPQFRFQETCHNIRLSCFLLHAARRLDAYDTAEQKLVT
jgi:hypothetical protein